MMDKAYFDRLFSLDFRSEIFRESLLRKIRAEIDVSENKTDEDAAIAKYGYVPHPNPKLDFIFMRPRDGVFPEWKPHHREEGAGVAYRNMAHDVMYGPLA